MTDAPRTAIVTGAAQGIGEAAARRLSREGVDRLLLVDRDGEGAARVAQTLPGAEALALDLADAGALRAEVGRAVERLGAVQVLVNAAGVTDRGGLHDATPETFDRVMAINARAPFLMMQAVAPAMPPGSVVVNVASMLAYGGPPFLLAYAASKAALVAITKGAANTLKRDGVRVFAINLGWTVTPAEREVQTRLHGLPESWADDLGAMQPFGRLLMPEDPAGLIAFLVSPDAAMMTGAIIDLDQFVAGTVDDNPGAG
jgi:NAD(P)-dependent dehydrogenase (short-subunit alcohol dehydrogenase family)